MESERSGTCKYCGVELNENLICPMCGESYKVDKPKSERIPSRGKLPSAELTDERCCKVCGYLLSEDSSSCDMCGSPVIQEEEKVAECLCPVCEHPLGVSATECPRCGINLEGEDAKEELQCMCPVCQEVMQIEDESCSHCGTKIWLDIEEEVRKVEEYRCPVCEEPVEEETDKCPSCGADVWLRDEDSIKEEAMDKIDEAETQIEIERKETRADLANAIRLLMVAREAFGTSDFARAARCASLSIDMARSAGLQKRILVDALRRAERMVALVNQKGGDVTKARELLESSKEEVGKGNYRKAVKMAIRGKVLAESSIPQEVVLMIDADRVQ